MLYEIRKRSVSSRVKINIVTAGDLCFAGDIVGFVDFHAFTRKKNLVGKEQGALLKVIINRRRKLPRKSLC